MSFIQFESARDKEKARKDLRDAREELLEKAKKNAELRAEREAQKELRGEKDWILPSISKKLKKLDKKSKPSKKSSSKKKTKSSIKKKSSKKSKKKKKRKDSSSSDSSTAASSDSDTDTEDSSSDSSCRREDRRKLKKSKKKRKRKHSSSSTSSESDSYSEEEKKSKKDPEKLEGKDKAPLQRDDWMMDNTLMLKTFSKDKVEKKPNNSKQEYQTYDPAKSSRELNPYWKSTGTGLPSFKKPDSDNSGDDDDDSNANLRSYKNSSNAVKSWQKNPSHQSSTSLLNSADGRKKSKSPSPLSVVASSESSSESADEANSSKEKPNIEANKFLTDQQMNELSAKLLKAEIMGNTSLAEDLKKRLDEARTVRSEIKTRKLENLHRQEASKKNSKDSKKSKKESEHILLTHTDQQGNARPLPQRAGFVDPRDLYGGRKGRRKQKSKRIETHIDGERVRYFPDDDKYDIKQMFEREKYSSAADSNMQFANISSKHKNPNDDLDDIFAEKVSKNISEADLDRRDIKKAINEHKKLTSQLENCDKCFESSKMDKQLMVAMGENVYLALPWHVGLQTGHCIIIPMQHTSCCTQLDEDTWSEINDFRKALIRMFASQRKDVIFFEIANKLHRKPHLSIHCIPIPESKGEMAPFYFKKAIEESEYEWCINKQLISLSKKPLRSSVPKGLPYFWVNFGMDSGFAHVIEDQDRFPNNFALEIIGGMLHLDANSWRKTKKEQNIIVKVKQFADLWKKYDCTS